MDSESASSPELSLFYTPAPASTLIQTLHTPSQPTSIASSENWLFVALQSGILLIYSLPSLQLKHKVNAHSRSISAMLVHNSTLLTASSDGTLKLWNLNQLLYTVEVGTVGDIFAIACGLYIALACQNTSIIIFDPNNLPVSPQLGSNDSFFVDHERIEGLKYFVPNKWIHPSCHFGYVYALVANGNCLISSSGDGNVKIWDWQNSENLICLYTLDIGLSTLSLCLVDALLYCGCQEGEIQIWDLETRSLIRRLMGHKEEVLSITECNGWIWSIGEQKMIKWKDYNLTEKLKGGLFVTNVNGNLVTCSEGIDVWDVMPAESISIVPAVDSFLKSIHQWITIPSITGPNHRAECRRAAKYLQNVFLQLGAKSFLLSGDGCNPAVVGKFEKENATKTILFYGHYDVVNVDKSRWNTDPFLCTGYDGYLYGRGVSDNKGPVLCAAFAASEVQKDTNVNIMFFIEGEEENNSFGLEGILEKVTKEGKVGKPDVILLSNSYWINDTRPCLTFGLRGCVTMKIRICSDREDAHSGVYGGAFREPMTDMIRILSLLKSDTIDVPGFYDQVLPLSSEEESHYDSIVNALIEGSLLTKEKLKSQIMNRWRYPSLTVHKIETQCKSDGGVIPNAVECTLSVRIVPNQTCEEIQTKLEKHLTERFHAVSTQNQLKIELVRTSEYWLGDINTNYFKLAETILVEEYGVKPLYIREGGSIGALHILEQTFNCPCIQIPIAQSSAKAHMPNERMSIESLKKGKNVFCNFFQRI